MQKKPINLISPQEKLRLIRSIYPNPSVPLPRLEQVVENKYYYRGDHTHIKCERCGVQLTQEEMVARHTKCMTCEEYLASLPYEKYVPISKEQASRNAWMRRDEVW